MRQALSSFSRGVVMAGSYAGLLLGQPCGADTLYNKPFAYVAMEPLGKREIPAPCPHGKTITTGGFEIDPLRNGGHFSIDSNAPNTQFSWLIVIRNLDPVPLDISGIVIVMCKD